MPVDKELLFKSRLPEADVDVLGVGIMRVRALSRAEVLSVQRLSGGPQAIERKLLALALVDPVLTEAEVGKWQRASTAAEMEPVTDAIAKISGMNPEAAKEAYKGFDDDPDAEFRALPGSEALDDSDRDAGADAAG